MLALIRHQIWLLRSDPSYVIAMIAMPVILIPFLSGAFHSTAPGGDGVNQAVPGMVVMFSLFLMSMVPFAVFQEHGWGTWERLLAAPVSTAQLMVGLVAGPLGCIAVQQLLLFGLGGLLYGLEIGGPIPVLVLVAAVHAVCLSSLGLALLAICRSTVQLNTVSTLTAITFAGLGGAITPIETLPGWALAIAPSTAAYWSMRAFRATLTPETDYVAIVVSIVSLLGFTTVFLAAAAAKFRLSDERFRNT